MKLISSLCGVATNHQFVTFVSQRKSQRRNWQAGVVVPVADPGFVKGWFQGILVRYVHQEFVRPHPSPGLNPPDSSLSEPKQGRRCIGHKVSMLVLELNL